MTNYATLSTLLLVSVLRRIAFALALASLAAVSLQPAQAQTYSVIHNFNGGTSGSSPYDRLTMDRAGNFYGTTYHGGSNNQGMIFKLSKRNGSWIFAPIYSFSGSNDGALPYAGVTIGPDGNLYGTTLFGGAHDFGTVFKLTQSGGTWTATDLYDFTNQGDGGIGPWSTVAVDASGKLYGTTTGGGMGGFGVVWAIAP